MNVVNTNEKIGQKNYDVTYYIDESAVGETMSSTGTPQPWKGVVICELHDQDNYFYEKCESFINKSYRSIGFLPCVFPRNVRGTARCSVNDTWDVNKGMAIAKRKAIAKRNHKADVMLLAMSREALDLSVRLLKSTSKGNRV